MNIDKIWARKKYILERSEYISSYLRFVCKKGNVIVVLSQYLRIYHPSLLYIHFDLMTTKQRAQGAHQTLVCSSLALVPADMHIASVQSVVFMSGSQELWTESRAWLHVISFLWLVKCNQ